MSTNDKGWLGWALFATLALVWGSSFILMKYGLQSFSYSQIGMLRIALAFWFTALIAFRRFTHLRKAEIGALVAVGLFGNAIPYLLFPLAVTELPSGLVGILNSMVPLFTLIIGVLWFKIRVGWPSIIGIFLGFAGAVWLLLPGLDVNPNQLIYGFFPIAATLCYAIAINVVNTRLQHLSPLSITLFSLSFVGVPATIYVFCTDFIQVMQMDPMAWQNLGYVTILGVVSSSLAVIIFNKLIKNHGPLSLLQ
ncbi:MAG: DMT family transporter [Owenweeksia sp.]|nr:DMT family transporter [Owenweeksia sp.]